MLLFCLTAKTYLSPQLLTCVHAHIATHSLPYLFILIISFRQTICTDLYSPGVLNISRFTFSSVSRFSLCVWLDMHTDLSNHLLNVPVNFDASGYNHENLPANSTVYMSIDAPVQKLSPFSVMHPFRFTWLDCSTYIYRSTRK